MIILFSRRARFAALAGTAWLSALIPFSCGQGILRAVTPVLLDDTRNALDAIIRAVAPLVLP
ncbi:MAG: hypothetical protein LC135_13015 [Phycisphaerae bacterium]|nr:hypothetical protein [Phycisphaerae bacterium]MCZ2400773.1 hypothetical protein [Phycisphaerae bacterium]